MKFFGSSFAKASFALIVSANLSAQSPELRQFIQSTNKIPSDQAIDRALKTSSLTTEGSPFHALLQVSQPGDEGSPYAEQYGCCAYLLAQFMLRVWQALRLQAG